MKRIFLLVIVLLLLSSGVGNWIAKRFQLKAQSFYAPIGFACILGLLQILYYPILFFNLSFMWIVGITTIVLGISLVFTVLSIPQIIQSILKKEFLVILVGSLLFLFVLSHVYVDLDYSDSSTYLNYIALNINAPSLNLYSLSNGLRGEEWNIYYQYQGYYHFCSYLCWLVNFPYYLLGSSYEVPNLVIVVWGLGSLYHILSSMVIVNLVKDLKTAWWFKLGLGIFLLFYENFFYWNISFAFYGNTFRALFVMLGIYLIYLAEQNHTKQLYYLLIPVFSAGLACSSTFLFMCFSIVYAFAVYLFFKHEEDAFSILYIIVSPVVFYVFAFLSRSHLALGLLLLVLYFVVLFLRNTLCKGLFTFFQSFFDRFGVILFVVVIPVLFMIGSFVIHLIETNDFTSYLYYFKDFSHSDMMTNYLFINNKWLDGSINVLRWLGVLFILIDHRKEKDWIFVLCLVMVVFFLNPLCTILLLKTITGMVFYRNFMVLFNPITEALLLYHLYQKVESYAWVRPVLACALVLATIAGNVGSFLEDEQTGLYWVYIRGGKEVDSIYKVDLDEQQAILALKESLTKETMDHQPVIVSQSGATLTYIPSAYQLFGPWQYYYKLDRVDEDFYQVARKRDDWQETTTPPYENTCLYLKGYQVDYVLLQYWQSSDFDEASDSCSVTIYEGSKYKVKRVQE